MVTSDWNEGVECSGSETGREEINSRTRITINELKTTGIRNGTFFRHTIVRTAQHSSGNLIKETTAKSEKPNNKVTN